MPNQLSNSYELLHHKIKRWIWKEGWDNLNDIQEMAIKPILEACSDVIISAPTASGKTEAAFLPACSHIINNPNFGFQILYISPLKALINDQFRRLKHLSECTSIAVTPWHGDVSSNVKNKRYADPKGIVLITPESLESIFVNKSAGLSAAFSNLSFIIIDEFHAFLGTERGCQLISLLHRLDYFTNNPVPRIALSATLSRLDLLPLALRHDGKLPCLIVESNTLKQDIQLILRGFIQTSGKDAKQVDKKICFQIFKELRGQSNLIFTNSIEDTEIYSNNLREMCNNSHVPNEFFPHHGNLAKALKEDLEHRFQEGRCPLSAICTSTLELGIDIGSVDSVAQIGTPFTVSSLRQRLGRSGRRDKPSVLYQYIKVNSLTDTSTISDKLHLDLFQAIAIINLMLNRWTEPPDKRLFHFSTLSQQVLSLIAQFGGFKADQAWKLLCKEGFFYETSPDIFAQLLRGLAAHDLITQTQDGLIVVGEKGELIISKFDFYTVFKTPVEYRLEVNGKTIGSYPDGWVLQTGQLIIFAGQCWKVTNIIYNRKVISLTQAPKGRAPIFSNTLGQLHTTIRKEMYSAYCTDVKPRYLDTKAQKIWQEGIGYFYKFSLKTSPWLQCGGEVYLFPWIGDKALNAISLILQSHHLNIINFGKNFIRFRNPTQEIAEVIKSVRMGKPITEDTIFSLVKKNNKYSGNEKYDHYLPPELLMMEYVRKGFEWEEAWEWFLSVKLPE